MPHILGVFGVPWIYPSVVIILQCVSTPLGNLSMLFNPGCPCLGNITLDMLMSPDIGRNNQCFFSIIDPEIQV